MNRLEEVRRAVDSILLKQTDIEERRCVYVHLYGVSSNCSLLALKRGADVELSAVAGMLHDIHSYKYGYSVDHAKLGSIEARRILGDINCFSREEIDIICGAIYNHSNKQLTGNTYEEILKDADVLQHHTYNTSFKVSENEKERLSNLFIELGINK
jgi:uncharacterized protein